MTDLATVTIEVLIGTDDQQDRLDKIGQLVELVGAQEYVLTVRGGEDGA